MAKKSKSDVEPNWEELIFEVGCLGCGKTAFTLPYREGTHHTMTCQQCGEITIAHVLTGGNLAMATAVQRDEEVERFGIRLEEYLSTWAVRGHDSDGEIYDFFGPVKLDWEKVGLSYFSSATILGRDGGGGGSLDVRVDMVINGLVVDTKVKAKKSKSINDNKDVTPALSIKDLSMFSEQLLVGPRNLRESPGGQ